MSVGIKLVISLLLVSAVQFSNCAAVVESSDSQKVSYTYTLWIGSDVSESYSISLESDKGISFYDAMVQAAKVDPKFDFEALESSYGHFITSIAGVAQNAKTNTYWIIYVLPQIPDENNKPASSLLSPVGVDSIVVEDGGNYLFWYQTL